MNRWTLLLLATIFGVGLGVGWSSVPDRAVAATTAQDPAALPPTGGPDPVPAALAGTPAAAPAQPGAAPIACVDAPRVMVAYLYRATTIDAMTAALDAQDDRWSAAQRAYLEAQRDAMASQDGPTEAQWAAVEASRDALAAVHSAIHQAMEGVVDDRARTAQREVTAAIERTAQQRGCSAVFQRSWMWGKESPKEDYTDALQDSALLWAAGMVDLNEDVLKELGLPRDALDPGSANDARAQEAFARYERMTTMATPGHEAREDAAPDDDQP